MNILRQVDECFSTGIQVGLKKVGEFHEEYRAVILQRHLGEIGYRGAALWQFHHMGDVEEFAVVAFPQEISKTWDSLAFISSEEGYSFLLQSYRPEGLRDFSLTYHREGDSFDGTARYVDIPHIRMLEAAVKQPLTFQNLAKLSIKS